MQEEHDELSDEFEQAFSGLIIAGNSFILEKNDKNLYNTNILKMVFVNLTIKKALDYMT